MANIDDYGRADQPNTEATSQGRRMIDPIQGRELISSFHEVRINKVENGFVINVGCKTFVAGSWSEASMGLNEYWRDPVAAHEKYCRY